MMAGYYLELAVRSLRRNPVLTMLMVLAIAVGIAASMTTLTVLHLLSRDPLPGRSSQLYYAQIDVNPTPGDFKEPLDMLDYPTAVALWSAHRAERQALIVDSRVRVRAPDVMQPTLMRSMLSTTSDFFTMFAVPFRYGHAWSARDDEDRARVAVISSELNDRLFGGGDSIGRILRLRDTDVRIVGVLKPWRPSPLFYGVAGGRFANGKTADFYGKPQDVFTPFFTGLELNEGNFQQFTCWHMPERLGFLRNAPCVWIGLWVWLGDPGKVQAYARFLRDYADEQKARGRIERPQNTRLRSLMEWLDYNHVVPSDVRLQTWLAFAFLAVCLSNTVCLLLAKFLRRTGDIGLRRALGATRTAVFAQCLVEAGVIGLLGGTAGWLLTLAGLVLVRRQPTAFADLVHLDAPMFALTFVLAIAASLAAGLLPAFRASRLVPSLQLKAL